MGYKAYSKPKPKNAPQAGYNRVPLNERRGMAIHAIYEEIKSGTALNKRSVEKLAATYTFTNPIEVKEMAEMAITQLAREIAQANPPKQAFYKLVELYKLQPNLSGRSSMSTLLQQYSTPAPISYIASRFVKSNNKDAFYLEPSAGNGLLTIAWPPGHTVVNEISENRLANLHAQGFYKVTDVDGSKDFQTSNFGQLYGNIRFDGMATNPPFGTIAQTKVDGLPIKKLEHYMAINALQLLKPNGKAAIVIGGHLEWDEKGRVKAGANRVFYAWLYRHFNVVDTLNINGKKLYSRMGTGFNVRLILIDGRATKPALPPLKELLPPAQTETVNTWDQLWDRAKGYLENTKDQTKNPTKTKYPIIEVHQKKSENQKAPNMKLLELEAEALLLELSLIKETALGAPYLPTSEACFVLDVSTPDSMAYEIHAKMAQVEKEVGGDFTEYVRKKLNYKTREALCDALAAEQIDGVAMGIYNTEKKNQGLIIGDQTGIGKGRMAAAMVKYANENGYTPIFITEGSHLFSDMYRDLQDIKHDTVTPFIVNSGINIKIGKKILHSSPPLATQKAIIQSRKLPSKYDFVMATYSQFNSDLRQDKRNFLMAMARNNAIIILDEAHKAGGLSQTGDFFKELVKLAKGVIFLSATFAKGPANMPLYAMKTSMQDASLTDEELVDAIKRGGVALQEVISSQLVAEGQMIRRERTYDGIKVEYITLHKKAQEHAAIADNVTSIVRDIIAFEKDFINDVIEDLDNTVKGSLDEAEKTKGTKNMGVDSTPYFSKVFNVVNQMLFSLKADEVANRAIERLRQGYKPVIAFSSTMESFISEYATDEIIRTDFTEVLARGLKTTLKYTIKTLEGDSIPEYIELSDLSEEAQMAYNAILTKISEVASGISISPIDHIKQKIEAAGYKVAEVTGRARRVELSGKGTGQILPKNKQAVNQAFFEFNNNQVDVLMINQTGSTGASAHAHLPKGGTISKADILPRAMIVLQAELNISTEVQKRGRINRTGQTMKPEYDYITSAIPAEQRLMMMLQKKLKSLDANTSSNQKSSEDIFNTDDFLNKYGDEVVVDYLWDRKELVEALGDPLKFADSQSKPDTVENAAHRVSGRVAILPVKEQQAFYDDVKLAYEKYVRKLVQRGEYDLEVETMDLQAETKDSKIALVGKGGSRFGTHTLLEKCEVNNLRKPYTQEELKNMIAANLEGKTAKEVQQETLAALSRNINDKKAEAEKTVNERWEKAAKKIVTEKGYKETTKSLDSFGAENQYFKERQDQIAEAKQKDLASTLVRIENQERYLSGLFNDFYIGKSVYYPSNTFDEGSVNNPAVFLGFKLDHKKPNPFAPSAIDLQFAVASSLKQIDLVASNKDQIEINAILGASRGIPNVPLAGLGYYNRFRKKRSFPDKTNLVKIYPNDDEISVKSDYEKDWIGFVKGMITGSKWDGIMWTWPVKGNEGIDYITRLKREYPNDRIEQWKEGEMVLIQNAPGAKIEEVPEPTYTDFIEVWDDITKESTANRITRYIATGNLLQGSGSFESGRLIQFTRKSGAVDNGILLPQSYNPTTGSNTIKPVVPIMMALKIIKSLAPGSMLNLSNSLTLGKYNYETWQLSVPTNKKSVYQSAELMQLAVRGEFFKTGNNFIAKYGEDSIDKAVKVLAEAFGVNATLTQLQFDTIKDDIKEYKVKELPPAPQREEAQPDIALLELEAEALVLELELLTL